MPLRQASTTSRNFFSAMLSVDRLTATAHRCGVCTLSAQHRARHKSVARLPNNLAWRRSILDKGGIVLLISIYKLGARLRVTHAFCHLFVYHYVAPAFVID